MVSTPKRFPLIVQSYLPRGGAFARAGAAEATIAITIAAQVRNSREDEDMPRRYPNSRKAATGRTKLPWSEPGLAQNVAPWTMRLRGHGARIPAEGRHQLPADVVRASQRERLLLAMLVLVAGNGYQATTVPEVVTRARVSRSVFYQEFESKLDCFLALATSNPGHDRPGSRSGRRLRGSDLAGGDHRGMDAYLRWWRDRPEFARAFLVELPAAGTEGLEHRIDLLRPFEDLFAGLARYMRSKDRTPAPLPCLAPKSVVRGTTDLIAEEVRRGRVATLPDLTGDLVDVISVALGGAPVPSRR